MSRRQVMDALKARVRRIERARFTSLEEPVFSSGSADLDRRLPSKGLVFGELVEWLGEEGAGAGSCGLRAAWQATLAGGVLVVLDRDNQFYPPAAAALGVDLEELVVIKADSWSEQLWSLDQALRCRVVAAVWVRLEEISQHDFRRLQLAAEQGQTAGMLIRSQRWLNQPSWAHLQLLVRRSQPASPPSDSVPMAINPRQDPKVWEIEITRARRGAQLQTAAASRLSTEKE